MGKGALNEEPLGTGGAHLVIVALNGKDDNPDLNTIRAFLATAAQGISYNIGTWRELSCNKRLHPDRLRSFSLYSRWGEFSDCSVLI